MRAADSLGHPIIALLAGLSGSAAWGAASAPGEAPLRVKLPFPPGQASKGMQGNRGTFSHGDELARVRPNGSYQSSIAVPITIYRDRD